MGRWKERIIIIACILLAIVIWRHQYHHKQSPISAMQMRGIQRHMNTKVETRFKKIENNVLYLRRLIDPEALAQEEAEEAAVKKLLESPVKELIEEATVPEPEKEGVE